MNNIITHKGHVIEDPPVAKFLFSDVRTAWVWLILRVWLGYKWFDAGLHKLDNPAWMDGGAAVKGFWTGAIQVPEAGRPPIAFDWYRSFIAYLLEVEAYTWFAKLVVYGEIIVGIALILGLFTGIAAFFSGFMNWNFIMAGAASTNGMLFFASVMLILAWKVAGFIGLDYFALPFLGTPWHGRTENADMNNLVTT